MPRQMQVFALWLYSCVLVGYHIVIKVHRVHKDMTSSRKQLLIWSWYILIISCICMSTIDATQCTTRDCILQAAKPSMKAALRRCSYLHIMKRMVRWIFSCICTNVHVYIYQFLLSGSLLMQGLCHTIREVACMKEALPHVIASK